MDIIHDSSNNYIYFDAFLRRTTTPEAANNIIIETNAIGAASPVLGESAEPI